MNDDLTQLASAYLDGDVTADERAQVEADPTLLAEVDRLRSVAVLLGDVESGSISMREQQLSTALDAWDRLPDAERTGANRDKTPRSLQRGVDGATFAGAAAISAPPSSLATRRRAAANRRLLGAAAAIVLVLAGGLVLQSVRSGSDDDSSSSAPDASTAAPEAASLAVAPNVEEVTPDIAADAGGGDAVEAETVTDGTALDTGILDAAPPGESALEQLESTDDLRIFASDAIGAPTSPEVPAATSAPIDDLLTDEQRALLEARWPLCLGADTVVGPARFGDVDVVVAIDEGRNLALAYVAATCQEVASVRLP